MIFLKVGTHQGTCCRGSFSGVTCPFLQNIFAKICPRNMMHGTVKFSWFEFMCHEIATKWPQFSMSHLVHCSCNLSLLQHRNEPNSTLGTPPCVNVRSMSTHKGAFLRLKSQKDFFLSQKHVL